MTTYLQELYDKGKVALDEAKRNLDAAVTVLAGQLPAEYGAAFVEVIGAARKLQLATNVHQAVSNALADELSAQLNAPRKRRIGKKAWTKAAEAAVVKWRAARGGRK